MQADGCEFVPDEGSCLDLFRLERCVDGEKVIEERCPDGQICGMGHEGVTCVPPFAACPHGLSVCTEAGNVLRCEEGALVEEVCAQGCASSVEEAWCREPSPDLRLHQGTLYFDYRGPNEEMNGWAPAERRPAAFLTVVSISGEEILDGTRVRSDGSFEILVREEPLEHDHLLFAAETRLLGGETGEVIVIHPDLEPGEYTRYDPWDGNAWAWSFSEVDQEEFVISEAEGSAAIQVYLNLYATSAQVASLRGPSLAAMRGVWAPGVNFWCPACYMPEGGVVLSGWNSKVHLSDAVTLHESGHWAYETLGMNGFEAGQHCLSVPSYPGLAFSEGYASWYSSDLRRDGRNYNEIYGTFYSWDIGSREPRTYFAPPERQKSLDQFMNETWVSAAMWDLARVGRASRILHEAMLEPELELPLASKYVGLYWWSVDQTCRPINPISSGQQTPIFADYLHALVCRGFSADLVKTFISPYLPYDPAQPICK